MGEAKRRKEGAAKRLLSPHGSVLPMTYYDIVAQPGDSMWAHVLKDIEWARENKKILDEMIPPHGEGKGEGAWATGFMRHTLTNDRGLAEQFKRWDMPTRMKWSESFTRAYRAILGYEHCGRATYYVHDSLSEALAYTQLNRTCDQLRLPLEGMALVFHDDLAREAFQAVAPSSRSGGDGSTITVFLRTDDLEDVGCRRLLIHGQQTSATGVVGAAVGRYLAMRDDWTLEQALRTDWSKDGPLGPSGVQASVVGRSHEEDDEEPAIKPVDMETFFDKGVMFARMVVNAILYIASRHALKVGRVDGNFASDVSGSDKARRYTVLGEGTEQLFSTVQRTEEGGRNEQSGNSGRRMTVRYLQAGFWRRPPNTPMTHPKDVWVSPHYRGPDAADLLHRARVVR